MYADISWDDAVFTEEQENKRLDRDSSGFVSMSLSRSSSDPALSDLMLPPHQM